jgi:hypothetical protein
MRLNPHYGSGHVNGHEEGCNVRCANTLRRAGHRESNSAGHNPPGGAQSLGQWMTAVFAMKGESEAMSVSDAVDMIRATPPSRRSTFAKEIWSGTRQRYGSSGRGDSQPF